MDSADEIVRKLLRVAIDRGASDIHLETIERRLRVRFRIDGLLQHFNLGDLAEDLVRQRPEVLSRIKILGGLDIAERRRPQDGSFRARVHCGPRIVAMDFRISVIPGYYGENAVIRILDPRSAPESIEALGLAPAITGRLQPLIRSTAGILLVTGPTGSGKSTTLYGMLKSVYRPEIKVVTAEDPIEYVCNDFSQHEVDTRVGNSFAQYLRSFLRHDPEVIMIGEIRDGETAELAFRAAQTGHFIISTLHTNDAIGAVNRLKDLGVDANVCTSALLGVMAQRLVRQICWNCKQQYEPPRQLLESVFDVRADGIRLVSRRRLRRVPPQRLQGTAPHLRAVDAEREGRDADQRRRVLRRDPGVGEQEHDRHGRRRGGQAPGRPHHARGSDPRRAAQHDEGAPRDAPLVVGADMAPHARRRSAGPGGAVAGLSTRL